MVSTASYDLRAQQPQPSRHPLSDEASGQSRPRCTWLCSANELAIGGPRALLHSHELSGRLLQPNLGGPDVDLEEMAVARENLACRSGPLQWRVSVVGRWHCECIFGEHLQDFRRCKGNTSPSALIQTVP